VIYLSFFDRFKRNPPNGATWSRMLSGYTPVFSQFGSNIYASDVVQQAISCIVSEIKKLQPRHVRTGDSGRDTSSVNSTIQHALDRPNAWMTTSDFLERIVWSLFLNYNAFIIPTYEETNGERRYTGFYPVQPSQVEFLSSGNALYVMMVFPNGYKTTLPYSEVIHIRYHYSINEYMGGDESGQPDIRALLDTLKTNHNLWQGVSNAMLSSMAVNGIVKYNTLLDKDKTLAAVNEMQELLQSNRSGLLPLDMKAEFIPISHDVKFVDSDTLKFIDEKILRFFGVPLAILTGDYNKDQYEAFSQKTLEPIIVSLAQGFTRTLFTPRELSFGNRIEFYSKDLIYMTTAQKLDMIRLLGDSGTIYENEKRIALGLQPLSELEGVRMMSLNYVSVEDAKQYQLGKLGGAQNE
jgi:HK97 family phage portal protein